VARDETRPFIVEVDGRRLSTMQAGFRVRKLDHGPGRCPGEPGPGRRRDWPSASSVALKPNTRLVLSGPAERPQSVGPEAVTRELAWRDGKLAFEGEP
jgi:transmembrane sensor